MKNKQIDSILTKQTNGLFGKGISPNSYHKIILPIIFIKFLTSKVEMDWKTFAAKNSIQLSKENYEAYLLNEVEFNSSCIALDYEYLWTNIKATSSDKIKQKLDGVFRTLEKYEKKYKDMSIYSFTSSDLSNSNLMNQIEYIENNYHFDATSSIDLFGYIYEFFLEKYNVNQGRGGEFYTPHTIVKMMASITEDRLDRNKKEISIYDPTMGSGGMLSQSLSFLVEDKGFDKERISFYGQELIKDTWNMSRMNFMLRTQSWNFGDSNADTFSNDLFKGKKFNVILSNPPFNIDFSRSDYGDLATDERFQKYGICFGSGKANYNFFTHIISHLSDDGIAAVVMQPAAGQSASEKDIRIKYLKDNLIEGIIRLPQNIFENASVGANIWIFNKNKSRDEILFVDLEKQTIRENKLEVISDITIKEITKVFNNFNNNENLETSLPHAIVKNTTILEDEEARISISQHVKFESEIEQVDKKILASELKKLKQDIIDNANNLEKTIDYLIK